ncbi:hypothetical protein GOBAR_DD00014 [Gossypium barbadense]|nr:hypothetical protein GOBAR_DD00014 [Gossypium barbadense]
MKLIVRKSLMFCSSLYIATSFFGVVLFGNHILDDVLANFDGDLGIPYSSLLDDLIRVSYGLHLMLVFPIVFSSLRLNVDANFIPSIWDAFQFTDATAAACVGYIFPAAITLRDTNGIATKKDRLISWMMIFLAVSTSTVAVTSAVHGWKPELMGKETIWVPFMRFTLKANLTNRGSVLYELAGNKVSFPACHEV